jgi:N-acetylmuramoyl-L-alanine amidase
VILAAVESAVADPRLRVTAVRHFASEARTRIVVELSGAVEPDIEAIGRGAPTRLYLDLPGVDIGPNIAKSVELPVGPLAGLRVGKRDLVTTRIILAARRVDAYDVTRLHDPPRVVVDLRTLPVARRQRHASRQGPDLSSAPRDMQRNAAAVPGSDRVPPSPPSAVQKAPTPMIATATAPGPTSHSRPLKIVIDPGHGGKDPGAHGIDGLAEKDVVLDISHLLASRLRKELGASVVLTRSRDVFVALEERTKLANKVGADLFISVHANASTRPGLAGVETYYLNNTNNRATIRLAAIENGLGDADPAHGSGQTDLTYILSDLVQHGKLEDSVALARSLQGALVGGLGREYSDVPDLGVKQGPFYVLVGAHMPCVLVEVSFLTNPTDGKRLSTHPYRDAIADGLAQGVREFLTQRRIAQTL